VFTATSARNSNGSLKPLSHKLFQTQYHPSGLRGVWAGVTSEHGRPRFSLCRNHVGIPEAPDGLSIPGVPKQDGPCFTSTTNPDNQSIEKRLEQILENFLVVGSDESQSWVFLACHLYAVKRAADHGRACSPCSSSMEVRSLICGGYKVAAFHSRGLASRYVALWDSHARGTEGSGIDIQSVIAFSFLHSYDTCQKQHVFLIIPANK
jgi:hypothetical protein